MTRAERKLKAIEQTLGEKAKSIDEIYNLQEKEERDPTDDERDAVDKAMKAIRQLQEEKKDAEEEIKVEGEVKDLSKNMGSVESVFQPARVTMDRQDNMIQGLSKSLGEIFTDSDGFKKVQDAYKSAGRLPQGVSTGAVPMELTKGTLTELTAGRWQPVGGPGPAGRPGCGRQAVPAADGRRPVALGAGDDELAPLCGRGHGHLWRGGCG